MPSVNEETVVLVAVVVPTLALVLFTLPLNSEVVGAWLLMPALFIIEVPAPVTDFALVKAEDVANGL